MNTVVTSREAILAMSRKMLREQGWTGVSVRSIAAACGISVGSIYNYFDSKEDLMSAVVESIWREIFSCAGEAPFDNTLSCVKWMFASMERGEERYPGFFHLALSALYGGGKAQRPSANDPGLGAHAKGACRRAAAGQGGASGRL